MLDRLPIPLVSLSFVAALACSSSAGDSPGGSASTGGAVASGGASATGGVGAGGLATGGVGASGLATGGVGTGGLATGGGAPTGGVGTGGLATGGGAPTGGTESGGAGVGGAISGGAPSTGGIVDATGGADVGAAGSEPATAGAGTGGSGNPLTAGACTIGAGTQTGSDQTQEQYGKADVQRNGVNYRMIANGWGQNWVSHDISWLGTSVTIRDYQGSRQSNGAPAGYPSVFCGQYSDTSLECGLPRALADITALNTVASWTHPDGNGTYNVAYDIWLGDGGAAFRGLQSYFMVWLHDPADEQPAGSLTTEGVEVANVPGVWNIISGTVNNLPIVNYVRAEGDDTHEIAFDIMDFIRDAQSKGLEMPGSDVLAVAIGFEIWAGPVTNLSLDDFCLDIQ